MLHFDENPYISDALAEPNYFAFIMLFSNYSFKINFCVRYIWKNLFRLSSYFTVLNINYIVHLSPNFGKLTFYFIKLILTLLITILLNFIHFIAFSEKLHYFDLIAWFKMSYFLLYYIFTLNLHVIIVHFTLCLRCLAKSLLHLGKNYILHLTMTSFLFNLLCLELWEGLYFFSLITCFAMLPLS